MFVLYQTSSYDLLLIGRSFAGILYGITFITFLLHIADNSSQFMRRYFIWTITTISIIPTVLFAEMISAITSICDVISSIGVLMFVLAVLTLIFIPCTYESIIFLLENGNDLRALEIMLKLRNESRHFIRRDFNEFKMMLAEDVPDGGSISSNGNSRPLISVLLLRLLNVLSSCNFIYWIFLAHIWFDYRNWTLNSTAMPMLEAIQDGINNYTDIDSIVSSVTNNSASFDASIHDFPNETNTITSSDINSIVSSETKNSTNVDSLNALDDYFALFGFHKNTDTTTSNDTDSTNTVNSSTSEDYSINQPNFAANYTDFNESMMADDSNVITTNVSDELLFIQTAYEYRLPILQITHFLLIVFVVKIVFGILFMCIAEKYQIYRNRIILKATFWISIVNLIFFSVTVICFCVEDNTLIFTFYMAKLLNIIYACYLLITFSLDTIGYCELAESFSLAKRYGCISCVLVCEHLFHVVVILLIMNAQFKFYFHVVQSIFICFICYWLLHRMPNECLDRTLRGARDKYFVKMANV